MVTTRTIQFSLNGGEISENLWHRQDLSRNATGLASCVNFIPLVQGGVTRRPGSRFVRAVKDATKPPRLERFVFSRVQVYVLEFGEYYVRFFMNKGALFQKEPYLPLEVSEGDPLQTDDGQVLYTSVQDPNALPYEIASPYTAAQAQELQVVQSSDVMIITHPDHPPRTLIRYAHTDWRFQEMLTRNGPFNEENIDETHILNVSGETGTVTVTSTADLFETTHVGSLLWVKETDYQDYSVWTTTVKYQTTDQVFWDGNVYGWASSEAGIDRREAGPNPPLHTEGTRWDGQKGDSILWRYLHSGWGIVRITGYTNARTVTAQVVKRIPRSLANAGTYRWRLGAWSAANGYPKAVGLFEQRAFFASTSSRPQTIWGSVSGDIYDFELGTLADDALEWTIESRNSNPIEALSDSSVMSVFAQDREFILSSSANGSALAPDDFYIRANTSYGSSAVTPVTVNNITLFVDRSGYRLIGLGFSYEVEGLQAVDLTIEAQHITIPGR